MKIKFCFHPIILLISGLMSLQASLFGQGIQTNSSDKSCGPKTCPLPDLGTYFGANDFTEYSDLPKGEGTIGFYRGGCFPKDPTLSISYGTEVLVVTDCEYDPVSGKWLISWTSELYGITSDIGNPASWPMCDCSDSGVFALNKIVAPSTTNSQPPIKLGSTWFDEPLTSNEDAPDDSSDGTSSGGCSTCSSTPASAGKPGDFRISIGMGSNSIAHGAADIGTFLDLSLNLANVTTLSLDSLNFRNLLGGGGALAVGSNNVKDSSGQVMATLMVATTTAAAPATDLQQISITVMPVAGSSLPVTYHTFEKVTSAGDFNGVGIKYTRTENGVSESLGFYNSGPGTCGVESYTSALGSVNSVYGDFKTVAANGDVQLWSAQRESTTFTWDATAGKWAGDLMEQTQFIPADSAQPKVVTERHYARIGGQLLNQSAKVLLSESVTKSLGNDVLESRMTYHGYYSNYFKSGTVRDARFGKGRWTASSPGGWSVTLLDYMPDPAVASVLETLKITPWLDGPSMPANAMNTQGDADAYFSGLAAQASGPTPEISGCQFTRLHDTTQSYSGPATFYNTREINIMDGVVVGTNYDLNASEIYNGYEISTDQYIWTQSRTERWNGAGTQLTWTQTFAPFDNSYTVSVDQTDVASFNSVTKIPFGETRTDVWRRSVSELNTIYSPLPDYVQGAMHPLWISTITDIQDRTVSEISKFSEAGTVIQTIDTSYTAGGGFTRSSGGVTLGFQSDDVTANGQTTTTTIDAQGITTTTVKDATTGELISETRAGITTSYAKASNPDGSTTQTVTQTAGGVTRTQSVTVTDAQGRTLSVTDANTSFTQYGYSPDGRTVTQTLPSGGTIVTTSYLDGQLKSITGTAVTPEFHHYAVNDGGDANYEAGSITETVYYITDNSSTWRKTTTNSLGQTLREEAPSPTGTGVSVTTHFYNTKGQRVKTTSPGLADLIIAYDDWGNVSQQGYDMNADGELTSTSIDLLTTTTIDYLPGEGTVLKTVTSQQYTHDAAETTLQTKTESKLLEGTTWQRTTQPDGTVITLSDSITPATTTRVVSTQQSVTGSQLRTQTYLNGLLKYENQTGMSDTISYGYNDFGQLTSVSHPLNGTVSSTYDGYGRLSTQGQTGGNIALYTYFSTGDKSLVQQVQNTTDGTSATTTSTLSFTYDNQGRQLTQDGTAAYPLRYEYDSMGRLWKLHTYRSGVLGDVSSGDITTWGYDPASGVLLSKTDALSRATTYTYDSAGRVLTRTWQRGVSATYGYDGAGRRTSIDYSDTTPDVAITYDGVGRPATSTDAAGSHTYTYDPISGGQLSDWSVTGTGSWSGLTQGYGYTQGRRTSRSTSLGGISLADVSYGYDTTTGRLSTVSASDFGVTYKYNATSGWNEGLTYTGGPDSTRYPDALMRLDSIVWKVGAATISGHDYTLNAQSRRTDAARQDGTAWSYGYNDRGEVTSAKKLDATAAPQIEPGKKFTFDYDGIGNRTSSRVSSIADATVLRSTGYTPNELNQYATITHPQPGWLVLRGSLNETAGNSVTIDGSAPTLTSGALWFHEQSVDNSGGPVRRVASITASRTDGGLNGGPVHTTQKGAVFIPPPSESPTYDLDGNLTGDARWTYTWDAENRLIAVEEKSGIPIVPTGSATAKRTRLEFSYDAQGRRINKSVYAAPSTGGSFVLKQSLLFLYDGWNMIAEIDTTSGSAQLLKSYEWGMDLSGTMTGAGGVGGLLAVRFHAPATMSNHLLPPGVHAPLYDGNGNVTELVNLASGIISARYEYGAFGELISVDGGVVAAANPFRFSTKYLDVETGLYNYGYRYYDAMNERWLSRDPIEEQGGVNLYCGLLNDGVNNWDYLGREVPSGPDWLGDQQRAADAMHESNKDSDFSDSWKKWAKDNPGTSTTIEIVLPVSAFAAATDGQILAVAGEFVVGKVKILSKIPGVKTIGEKCCQKVKVAVEWLKYPKAKLGDGKPICSGNGGIITLFHKGNLKNGKVSPNKGISTSTSPNLDHYRPGAPLNQFDVPKSKMHEWQEKFQVEFRRDLKDGIETQEIRILPPSSGELNDFLK